MKISYLLHADIDKKKWDQCIDDAGNSLIYAYSFYLDAMSKNWAALVMNDYEAVMPLTWNRKFGIAYLRQPFFTQQSGIFGNFLCTHDITKAFLNKAFELFEFAEISLNYANELKSPTPAQHSNLILPLHHSFGEIQESFKNGLRKNIKKANSHHLIYTSSEEIEKSAQLYKRTYSGRFCIPDKEYRDFLQLCFVLQEKEQIFVRKVISKNGQLLAISTFLKDKKRIYNIMPTTLPEGRKTEASHFLLFELIKEFSGQDLILDFEGSEIPSVHFFYKKFGAVEQPYPTIRMNRLKPWQRVIKKLNDELKYFRN